MPQKTISSFLLVLIANICLSQNSSLNDSFINKSFDYLETNIKDSLVSDALKPIYINAFLQKAKNEKDTVNIGNGYYFKIFKELYFKGGEDLFYQNAYDTGNLNRKLVLADSMIKYTKSLNHFKFPGLSYSTRSYLYYISGNEIESLNDALIAYGFAKIHNNKAQLENIQKAILAIKGNYNQNRYIIETRQKLDSIKKVPDYKEKHKFGYLSDLNSLISDLQENKNFDLAKEYTKEGIEITVNTDHKSHYYGFVFSAGINHYFSNNFEAAMDSINKSQNHLIVTSLSLAYYLKGKIFERTDTDKALGYFNKVDSIFQINHAPIYGLKDNYKSLLNIYKDKNNYAKQIETIDKLIYADSVVSRTKFYINERILEAYEVPEFKKEKETIILKLKAENFKNRKKNVFLWSSLLALGLISVYFYYTQHIYKKRYKKLMGNLKPAQEKPSKTMVSNADLNIPNDTVNDILKALETFEKEKQFTKNTITLNNLAKQFDTNNTYLSKIINTYKGKSFNNYITDLRVDYIINELNQNHILRKMTIKAIALEIGFNNPESFSKAFYKKTGIKPSYFIKQIEKENKNS
ncbi:helix-turn-helix domain-containing protein [Xanthomarina sp. F2636L]|uniref:helix-turn-helix domain-containing protein n=1 Tax=Xanthomarina sp. F2636L TaxID=2996018 RepID=UPI00225E51A7|nr:helix-turn-helix transcriptional regulator [Xanthomarina sp. F2636L]MCX7549515.1 helix-turn-helix transcriptional regulator [Xanthomarina sp. F2636L]